LELNKNKFEVHLKEIFRNIKFFEVEKRLPLVSFLQGLQSKNHVFQKCANPINVGMEDAYDRYHKQTDD
jgi:hypothetical protein